MGDWGESETMEYNDNVLDDVNEIFAGKIETLQMTNFMCHSNLELKFNQMINFITGRNGSGKSAILTALIVVLGGTASVTGRGSGISDFIKKGENWARISITLLNEGVNSYKREIYGSKIVVCRDISKSGSNSYSCKSEGGSIVSKKKEEIDSIVLAFNWQIKNPVCVLNQDVARGFLCASDGETRFKMFAKATQLENLKTIYVETMELLLTTKKQMMEKKKGIEEAQEEIAKVKEKLEFFVTLEKHVHQKRNLEDEYLWSLVLEEEKKLERAKEKKKKWKEKKNEISEWGNDFEKISNELKSEESKLREEMEKFKSAENEKKMERYKMNKKIQELEKEMERNEIQLRQVTAKRERHEADMKGVKEHLNQCDANSSRNEEERMRANEKMIRLRENLSELREKIAIAEKEFDAAVEAKMNHSKIMENLKCDLGELEQNKKRLEITAAMKTRDKSRGNLLKFGHFTPDLLKAIEDAQMKNVFYKKPVGPCGMHVRLSGDPKWARAVESVIGGLMTTYCCDNQKDFQALTRIMDRICGEKQPTIIISKFLPGRHDVELKKASVRDHPSILDVLKFDNDVVFNAFIDQARIETIVLFETDKQAASVMTHVQNVPKNLKMGLTLASDQYFPAPNYRTYYGNASKPLRYLDGTGKTSDCPGKLEAEMKAVERDLEKKTSEMAKARRGYVDSCESLERFQMNLKELRQRERKIQVEENHLKDIEDSRPVAITKLALEEELLTIRKKHEEATAQADRIKETLESLGREKSEVSAQINALFADGENEDFKRMEERLEEAKDRCRRLMSQKKEADSKEAELRQKLAEVDEEISKLEKSCENKAKEAEKVRPERMETEKSPVEVQKLLEKCERYLKAAEKITGTKEDAINGYKTKMESFKGMKKMVAILETTMEVLVKATRTKLERLKILQTHTASLVSFHFQATLQTRGYDGQLKVDFDRKILNLEVTPKDGSDPRKDPKTLSGGERSYSTVSFILAVWKVVNVPVYFLDEFDVFMDKVNRKVIMDLLLEHATSQRNKQFVFITPQDISSIRPSERISVYRLPNPKRKAID